MIATNASIKTSNGTHAWIITTNNKEHFGDPEMHLSGSGPIDGNSQHLSSTRGEIQGQTAALHMANILLQSHNTMHLPVHINGDNKGVQSKCARCNTNRIRDHREANFDLFYKYKAASNGINKTIQWVKSHQDHGYPWESQQDLL